MASKYVDVTAITQVIGCIYNDPGLLDLEDTYVITDEDFVDDFHKVTYGALGTMHELGVRFYTVETLTDFFDTRPKAKAIFESNKGYDFLNKISKIAQVATFKYYYDRVKKMSLFRAYEQIGLDLDYLYNPDNILDLKKRESQEEWFDNTSLQDIANIIDEKISVIKERYVDNDVYGVSTHAADGVTELLAQFEKTPDVGVPLYGPFINTITRGARLGKFYLRSAPTGVGKTRSMIADACYISCTEYYDEQFGWISNGKPFPTLFIGTEQDKSEIQTMIIAFLSNVNEEHIVSGKYVDDERERVYHAAEVLAKSALYIEELPEFNLQDVENTIKRNIRERGVKYIFHDYIHTSIKILEEISKKAGKIALREDNILFMLSARLKEICVKYGVFMMSATQLNGDYQTSTTPDQNLLRGAKAIADKIDYGSILLPVTDEDLASLENVLAKSSFATPTIKLSIYKNRRGRYKGVILWCQADLGTCRIHPMFMTNFNYELQTIDNIKIVFEEESAF